MNADAGTVYGQVIAKMGDSVFMLPMKTLTDEIEGRRKSSGSQVTVFLPSPSILLADLAEYHRHILDDTETADRYEQAAIRARQLDRSEDTPLPLRPILVSSPPPAGPDSAWRPDPARTLFPGMDGRDTAEAHSPPTPKRSAVWPKEDVARKSNLFPKSSSDLLARYANMEFFKRAEFYDSLHASDQRQIYTYRRRITNIRRLVESGQHSNPNHVKNVHLSVKSWRDSTEYRRGMLSVRRWRSDLELPFDHSEGVMHDSPDSPDSQWLQQRSYEPSSDMKATKTRYVGNDSGPELHVDGEQEVIDLMALLDDPAAWLQKGVPPPPDDATHVTHIHIPGTNIEVRTVSMQTWLT